MKISLAGTGKMGSAIAARLLSEGHQVTVWGQGALPGGKAQLQSRLPISESLSSIADYQLMQLQLLGVDLRLGQQVTAEEVLAWARRIERTERFGALPQPGMATPAGIPSDYGEHMDLMYDLPSRTDIKRFTVTRQLVEQRSQAKVVSLSSGTIEEAPQQASA